MAGLLSSKSDCYCAFCKSKRLIYRRKHAGIANFLVIGLFSFLVSTGLWTWWDPRSIAIFSVSMVGAEVFIYLRWRFTIVCSMCGFDPVLYRKSSELARDKVRRFYEARTQDPKFFLSRSPLVDLYRQSVDIKRHNDRISAISARLEANSKELVP